MGALSGLRGAFFDAIRIFSFASSTTVPACLGLTPGRPARCLLERSCARRKRRRMPNQPNVGKCDRFLWSYPILKMFSFIIRWRKDRFGPVAKRGPARSPFPTRPTRRASESQRERDSRRRSK